MRRNPFCVFFCILITLILSACNSIAGLSPTSTPTQVPQATVVSLTFDDGNTDNFDVAPLLKANGLHATFYIPSGLVETQGYMTWDQLKTLQDEGNEIGGHTLNHTSVQGLDAETLRHEICDDRTNLLDHGFKAISFAYPHGSYDVNAQNMVKNCGYLSGRGVHDGPDSIPPSDFYALQALPYIVDDTDLAKIERYVTGTRKDGGGWVILIFHHICDSCDYFSVKPDVMNGLIPWLAKQQTKGNFKVMTVGEVVSGGVSP